jgi:hypothetical protein
VQQARDGVERKLEERNAEAPVGVDRAVEDLLVVPRERDLLAQPQRTGQHRHRREAVRVEPLERPQLAVHARPGGQHQAAPARQPSVPGRNAPDQSKQHGVPPRLTRESARREAGQPE